MSIEQWLNGTESGKLKYWKKNIIRRGWYMYERMEQWWNDTGTGKLKYC